MTTTAPVSDPIAEVERDFRSATTNHQMTVLRDDGVYRHLRFKAPDTGFYRFDLVTWPGHLSITGDTGSYTFARTEDMFAFFRTGISINPHYWAEKAVADSDLKAYSEDLFRQHVTEHIADYAEEYPGLADAVQEQIFDGGNWYHEQEARELLDCFEHENFRFHDSWEWDFRDFTYRFLWCCHAIRWGIEQYDNARDEASAA